MTGRSIVGPMKLGITVLFGLYVGLFSLDRPSPSIIADVVLTGTVAGRFGGTKIDEIDPLGRCHQSFVSLGQGIALAETEIGRMTECCRNSVKFPCPSLLLIKVLGRNAGRAYIS